MQISLKRALKLRKELEALVSKQELPLAVQVSLLIDQNVEDPLAAIKPGTQALVDKIDEYQRLSQLLSTLRIDIAKANVANGIDASLAEAAHATRMMSLLRKVAAASPTPDVEQLKADLAYNKQALNNPERNSYDRPQRSTNLSVVLPELREKSIETAKDWKRRLESLEDSRTGRNASVKIEIVEDDAQLLQQLGLI